MARALKQLVTKPPDEANSSAFNALRTALRQGRMLAFIGAGVSRRAGYPLWKALLEKLHDHAVRKKYLPEEAEAVRRTEDLLWRAQFYRRELGEARFYGLLKGIFKSPRSRTLDPFMRDLLGLPFAHVLTTNYDDLLTDAHRKMHGASPEVVNWTDDDRVRKFINQLGAARPPAREYVHLHGRINEPQSLVLTDADYAERYLRSEDTRRKLFTIFATQRVVFIGFSMSDPDLQSLIRLVNASVGGNHPRHFAILALEQSDGHPALIRQLWNQKFGIEPIFYPVVKDHKALEGVVGALARGTARRKLPSIALSAAPASKQAPATERASTRPVDAEDPQRGQWGGRAEHNGRRLSAKMSSSRPVLDHYDVRITLESTDKTPLVDPIRFHLHDTFEPQVWEPDGYGDQRRSAYLDIRTYGAFTVGVEADRGATRLEFDLTRIKGAPPAFREG